MADLVSWLATAATIAAACLTASNLGTRVTGYGFAVFTIGSILWLTAGLVSNQPALAWTNAVLTILNLFGVWRWLGRQAGMEKGAQAAADASEERPGEALFQISLLERASVRCGPTEVGHCVDAMAGSQSGKLAYIVVSAGGIAGVGETLRRLPWNCVEVQDEAIVTRLGAREFSALETLERDEWPTR
jgi:hypothetical protein